MRAKRRILLVLLPVALLAIGGVGFWVFKERVHESYWISQLQSTSRERVARAQEELAKIGTHRALQPLLEVLAGDSRFLDALVAHTQITWSAETFLAAWKARESSLGFGAGALARRLADADPQRFADESLAEITAALRHESWSVFVAAVDALGAVGPAADPALQDLIASFARSAPEVEEREDLDLTEFTERAQRASAGWVGESMQAIRPDGITDPVDLARRVPRELPQESLGWVVSIARVETDAIVESLLAHEDPFFREFGARWLGYFSDPEGIDPLCARLDDSSVEVRRAAAAAIVSVSADHSAGWDELGPFDEVASLEVSATALVRITEALADADAAVRRSACLALRSLAPRAAPKTIPALVAQLDAADGETRVAAVEALGRLGARGESIRTRLLGMLGSKDEDLVVAAMFALARTHPGDVELATAMVPLLASTSDVVRLASVEAITVVGEGIQGIGEHVVPLLGDSDWEISQAAFTCLSHVPYDASKASRVILDALESETMDTWTALLIARDLDEEQVAPIRERISHEFFADPEADVADFVSLSGLVEAFGLLGARARSELPAIRSRLEQFLEARESDEEGSYWVDLYDLGSFLRGLVAIGGFDVETARQVLDLIESEKVEFGTLWWEEDAELARPFHAFLRALPWEPEPHPFAWELIEILARSKTPDDSIALARALENPIFRGERAETTLLELLGRADANICAEALRVASTRSPGARLVDAIREASTRDDVGVRRAALHALGEIGPAIAESSMSALERALDDEDPGVCVAAIDAIGKLGPAARTLEASLRAALEEPRLEGSARRALARLGLGP